MISRLEDYKAAVFNICELLHNKDDSVVPCLKKLVASEDDVDFIAPIGYIANAFSLTDKETLALCVSAQHLWQHRPLPTLFELCELCDLQTEPIHHIFATQQDGEVLSHTLRSFIMGAGTAFPSCVRLHLPTDAELFHSHEILNEIQCFCNEFTDRENSGFGAVVLTGGKGTGKTFLLTRLAQQNGGTLLEVDLSTALPENVAEIAIVATLYRSIVCIINTKNDTTCKAVVSGLFNRLNLLFFADAVKSDILDDNTIVLNTELKGLTPLQRGEATVKLFGLSHSAEKAQNFSIIYNASIGNLVSASMCYTAEVMAGRIDVGDESTVLKIIKNVSAGTLGDNADKIITNKRLGDVVLPMAQGKKLEEIISFIRNKRIVYEGWNFNDKIPYGRGIAMLFYGASGTGKTLAASAMANELGLDLYRVDLSRLISKYIGDTQKNIGKIFDDAERCDCILFFDEADALFSKRTDSSDAQDKYSNAEIAYLLQRTEHYDGAIILATNLLQNFDEAFRRRIDYMVHFPLPDERLRQKLWDNIFPAEAPLEDINTGLLAKHIELSGAGIRNTAVNAALIAAGETGRITMGRIIRAARAEYEKQNKQLPANLLAMFADN